MPDLNAAQLRPLHDPWYTLTYAAHSADARGTVVDGRVPVRSPAPTTPAGKR